MLFPHVPGPTKMFPFCPPEVNEIPTPITIVPGLVERTMGMLANVEIIAASKTRCFFIRDSNE